MSEDTKPTEEETPKEQPKEDTLETQSENKAIPDAQPKEDVSETQSKDEEIPETKPDAKRKEPLSRADYHNVIVAYVAIVLSLISLFVDVIQAFPRESIQILRAEDDGYYHFDGERLFKNFQVTVANNSAIPVSVVEITVERDGEARTFEISDLPDILPLNMDTNHSEIITIPWEIFLSSSSKSLLDKRYISNESELLITSRDNFRERANAFFEGDSEKVDYYAALYEPKKIPLSIMLCTAKNSQYSLKTEDMGKPSSVATEGDWVVIIPFRFGVTLSF